MAIPGLQESASVLERIRELLTAQSIAFRELHHEPTRTSEDSARVRGEPLHHGGKALLLKGDAEFALFVLPADRQLDSNAIRQKFGWRKLRFATPEELKEQTGLVPGSVPPFGPPILPFDLYLDEEIPHNERIAFNAGSLTDSIILATADYLRVAQPKETFCFSKGEPGA
jgi:prolyl-tRNA editing enzyme YbaK/EbsC (Cys-tRNA(Pro) deacylase)